METNFLTIESGNLVKNYLNAGGLIHYEAPILNEIIALIDNNNLEALNWFNQFGKDLRAIVQNVNAYRKALAFGFSEINLSQYGWFEHPKFFEIEEIAFGNIKSYHEHSTITLGRGINHVWTYAVDSCFGCAACSYGLSVFGEQHPSRQSALDSAITELEKKLIEKVGNSDTTNYKQPVIKATLKDIAQFKINLVQLSLF